VPPGRYATVEVNATGDSTIPGDLGGTYQQSLGTRTGSIYLADTSISHIIIGGKCGHRRQ
jgi:hypothetical protein